MSAVVAESHNEDANHSSDFHERQSKANVRTGHETDAVPLLRFQKMHYFLHTSSRAFYS
jgi:hypothetical protein